MGLVGLSEFISVMCPGWCVEREAFAAVEMVVVMEITFAVIILHHTWECTWPARVT